MRSKVNLAEKTALLEAAYRPGIVGYFNDYKLAVVKILGDFVWHTHSDTDELFLVTHGQLTIRLRDGDVELSEGDVYVVPKGVEHCPTAETEAHVLLIEPAGTRNTGDAGGARTVEESEI